MLCPHVPAANLITRGLPTAVRCALHFACLQTQIDKHHGIHHDGESQNKKRFWQKNHTLHDGALSSPKGKATRGGESSPGAPNTTFETSQKE
jgi:hypothetical protein